MMLVAKNIGKKYGKNWVFRRLQIEIKNGSKVAITGKNGAGKSTLLQLLSGYLTPSEGLIEYDNNSFEPDQSAIVYIGPYTEIIEEMTLLEFLDFHSVFKKPLIGLSAMADKASLPLHKSISDFSTGMKQRVKLITAFYFENELIFMDEPTSNLDQEGFEWWKKELNSLQQTTLIASNDQDEIALCEASIHLP